MTCNHVHICVCNTPKFELLTDTSVSLPISNPPWSGSVVSEPPVPVLDTNPQVDIQFLYRVRRGPPVSVLVKTLSSNGPEPGTSLLFMSMLLPLHTCHCNHVYICVKTVSHRYSCLFAYF